VPYRPYPPATPSLVVRDPVVDLPADHLARLVDQVVDEAVHPPPRPPGPGQPPFDPRLTTKVLVYGYATGVRSSRRLEQLCDESLPYLFLTRGDTPSYGTLCSVRVDESERIEQVFVALFAVAQAAGMWRVGHIVVDSTKIRANASPEAVLTPDEYEPVRQELRRILQEAQVVDDREDQEGRPGTTRLGKQPAQDQMRDIVRRVRKRLTREKRRQKAQQASSKVPPEQTTAAGHAPAAADDPVGGVSPTTGENSALLATTAATTAETPVISARMRERVEAAVEAIEAATAEGRKHLCLTDPEARMMYGGRVRQTTECHSFEVAVDNEAGLLVAGETSQASSDCERLEPLVEAARANEPEGVAAVTGDSGYYGGDAVGRLIGSGIDTCIPEPNTAADLHRGLPIGTTRAANRGSVPFEYDAERDLWQCPEGNTLGRRQQRQEHGQQITVYRAQQPCLGCPRAGECLTYPGARFRTLGVGENAAVLAQARERFAEPEHQERYRRRGDAVETVFGFIRGTLGYAQWFLRGKDRVACEGRLFKAAYQFRKVHIGWAAT
jgi:transposase